MLVLVIIQAICVCLSCLSGDIENPSTSPSLPKPALPCPGPVVLRSVPRDSDSLGHHEDRASALI